MRNKVSRRNFVQNTGLATMAIGLSPQFIMDQSTAKMDKVRLGIIGTGYRGQNHIDMLCERKDTEIIAFADPDKQMLADAQKILKANGRPAAI
jgi:FlaA1/EpsC-like NDP-sugar epimerase